MLQNFLTDFWEISERIFNHNCYRRKNWNKRKMGEGKNEM